LVFVEQHLEPSLNGSPQRPSKLGFCLAGAARMAFQASSAPMTRGGGVRRSGSRQETFDEFRHVLALRHLRRFPPEKGLLPDFRASVQPTRRIANS
jgi:hypothetical protein